MKFLLDANIPYSVRRIFRKPDHAIHVRDIGLGDATDDEILQRALKEGAVLITRDLDFANAMLHPRGTHGGIIVIRVPPHFTGENIVNVLKVFFASLTRPIKESLVSGITIVEPGQYRMRR